MRQTVRTREIGRSCFWMVLAIGLLLFAPTRVRAEGLSDDELDRIKQQFFFFQNKYFKNNAWDCSRSPANAEAGTEWHLFYFKAAYDASTGRSIDFGTNSDRYLQFDIVNFEENGDNENYSYLSDDSGNKLIINLKLYEADGTFVSTISNYGTIQGLGKEAKGLFYEQQGHYGTFLTMEDYNPGDQVTYTPETGVISQLSELELMIGTWKYDASQKELTHKSGLVIQNVTASDDNKLSIGDNTQNTALTHIFLNLTGRITDYSATDANTEYTIGKIGDNAFQGVALQSLTLPASITEIGANAFAKATLPVLNIQHESLDNLTIGTDAFALADKGQTMVYVPVGSLEAYHTEDREHLTVRNWQDFTYLLESGAKTYAIEYVIDEAHKEAIAGLPTQAPVGQLFTFPIRIEGLAINITPASTIGEEELFSYDSTGETKLAVKLNEMPEVDKLIVRINESIHTDSDKGLIIESSTEYKEGEEDATQGFNGIIEAGEIESLRIGKTDEATTTVAITLKGTNVKPSESGEAVTTILLGATAILTLSGTNDLGMVANNGTLTFRKESGEGEAALGANTKVTNNAIFTDETGWIRSVSGEASIKVAEGTSMEQAISIERGKSQMITLTASTSGTAATLSYAWQKLDETTLAWDNYPQEVKENTPVTLKTASDGTITLSEAGRYRCLLTSTAVPPTQPVTRSATTTVSSTLTAYVTVTLTEPEPDPICYYTVTIPEIEGATISVESGYHEVEEGDWFEFTITLDEAYDQSIPSIKANGETIEPDEQGRYVIQWIYTDQTIEISGIVKNLPTGIGKIGGTAAKVWGADGTLHIYAPETADVHIANFSGKTIQTARKIDGKYHIRLPKGHYIVTIGDNTFKISL